MGPPQAASAAPPPAAAEGGRLRRAAKDRRASTDGRGASKTKLRRRLPENEAAAAATKKKSNADNAPPGQVGSSSSDGERKKPKHRAGKRHKHQAKIRHAFNDKKEEQTGGQRDEEPESASVVDETELPKKKQRQYREDAVPKGRKSKKQVDDVADDGDDDDQDEEPDGGWWEEDDAEEVYAAEQAERANRSKKQKPTADGPSPAERLAKMPLLGLQQTTTTRGAVTTVVPAASRRKPARGASGDDLLDSFKNRLAGSTFRMLNEQIYTNPSPVGAQFLRDEATFQDYHDGYRKQLDLWPVRPALIAADALKTNKFGLFSARHYKAGIKMNGGAGGGPMGNEREQSHGRGGGGRGGGGRGGGRGGFNKRPRDDQQQQQHFADSDGFTGKLVKSGAGLGKPIPTQWVVCDMGCGDAELAREMSSSNKVHSFDYRAVNDAVVACDMANVPLDKNSCDVVVFSLSLMATNWLDYIFEAKRVLKPGRLLKIIEVRSRMPAPSKFTKLMWEVGFVCEGWGVLADYFCIFDFTLSNETEGVAQSPDELRGDILPSDVLLPCLYKRR